MRYYKIDLTDAKTGTPVFPSSLQGSGITSVLGNGLTNPGALNIEFDIPVAPYHQPDGQALVRIWGLSLADIGSAADLNGVNVSVYAGMAKGLPLANPSQARLLIHGQVLQAFGNWVGTDMTVDLIISPSTGTPEQPFNYILNWQAGTQLSNALSGTLTNAIPNAKLNMSISPSLVLNHDEVGYYETLDQLSATIHDLSRAIITDPNYPGVSIAYDGNTITVSDQTTPPSVITIQPQDLIGQPTWIGPQTISARFVLRGDLDLQDVVALPHSLISTTAAALRRFSDQTTFTGNFVINRIHHYGNYRQADSASWATVVEMYPQGKYSNG